MSSISKHPDGTRRIQFFNRDKQRRSIRLGKVTDERAKEIQAKVDALNADAIAGCSWRPETARWVAEVQKHDADLFDKLAAADLVPKREKPDIALKAFLDGFIASRKDWKPTTRSLYERVRDNLVKKFGADRMLATITPFDAQDFRRHLRANMAESTTRKECSRAKTMFQAAVDKRLLVESPFVAIKKLAIKSAKKFHVTREMADKVLEACINNEWRLIFVLCRYGGLRCPSEVLALSWDDVNWEHNRLTVHSPKTEHHEGKESRIIPLFPEVRDELEKVAAEVNLGIDTPLSAPIITRYRKTNANLRTQFERTIKSAGLKPWPVLFNSLRASRARELHDRFPSDVANAWMGHSEKVAEKHYLEPTDHHFEGALHREKSEPTAPPPSQNCTTPVHSPVPGRTKVGMAVHPPDENVEKFANSRRKEDSKAPWKEPSS